MTENEKIREAAKHLIDAHAELVRAIGATEGEEGAAALISAEAIVADAMEVLGYECLARLSE